VITITKVNLNTTDNIAILSKYLIKYYGEDTAKDILVKNRNNLFGKNGIAYQLGKQSFEFFNMYFLQDLYTGSGKAELSPTHKEIWEEVEDSILNINGDHREFIISRGFGKTSTISLPLAIWCNLYNYSIYTVISSSIGATAEQFIAEIKMIIKDNEYIKQAFGEVFNKNLKNNTEELELDTKPKRTMIRSISANSSFRGTRYGSSRITLLILDDYQNETVLSSEKTREKFINRFFSDADKAIEESNFHMVAVGTIQMKNDFYHTLSLNPVWKTKIKPGVLIDNVDELYNNGLWLEFKKILTDPNNEFALEDAKEFYYNNEKEMQYPLLWQDYWDCLSFALKYYQNPVSFKIEIQNDIDNIGEKLFKTIITKPSKEIEQYNFIKTILSVDPATGTAAKNDYSAFCVMSESDNNIRYARKGIIEKLDFEDYIKQVIQLLKDYEDITHVNIEKNTYMGSDVLKIKEIIEKDSSLRARNIVFINKMQNQNKDARISSIVGEVNLGQIILNEDDKEFIEQVGEFAGCKYTLHDDAPDCLTSAVETIRTIENIPKLKLISLSEWGL
jgi:predicted phage terminase large subunit-like protein